MYSANEIYTIYTAFSGECHKTAKVKSSFIFKLFGILFFVDDRKKILKEERK